MAFNEFFRMVSADLKDESAGQTLSAAYDDFAALSGQIFPQKVSLKSESGTKSIRADFIITRIDIDTPVEMPFSVPSRYSLKE
jgi:hypothetical protein